MFEHVPYELSELMEIKISRLNRRAKSYGKPPVSTEELAHKVKMCFNEGFTCEYCNHEMSYLGAGEPYSFTFDHVVPLSHGGQNDSKNMAIVCNLCNSLKGIMGLSTFKDFLKGVPEKVRLNMWKETHGYRISRDITEYLCDTCFNFTIKEKCFAGMVPERDGRFKDLDSICGMYNVTVK